MAYLDKDGNPHGDGSDQAYNDCVNLAISELESTLFRLTDVYHYSDFFKQISDPQLFEAIEQCSSLLNQCIDHVRTHYLVSEEPDPTELRKLL